MKAITLHQPWASLIAAGTKTIETRSWAPPRKLLGQRIAIHAAKKNDRETFRNEVRLLGPTASVPRGVVVATARLEWFAKVQSEWTASSVAVIGPNPDIGMDTWNHNIPTDEYGDFSPGRWLWFLEDIEPLDPPIPAKGRQGFWNWDAP